MYVHFINVPYPPCTQAPLPIQYPPPPTPANPYPYFLCKFQLLMQSYDSFSIASCIEYNIIALALLVVCLTCVVSMCSYSACTSLHFLYPVSCHDITGIANNGVHAVGPSPPPPPPPQYSSSCKTRSGIHMVPTGTM